MNTPVWTLLSPKGGAGKTTVALILAGEFARHGAKVTLIDADPNLPLVRWYEKGNHPDGVKVVADIDEEGSTILDTIEEAQATSDMVIIDTEGTNNLLASHSIGFSSLVLIPVQSSTDDLVEGVKAIEFVKNTARAKRADIQYMVVRTLIDPVINDREEKLVFEALNDIGAPVGKSNLLRLSAFKTIRTLGCTIYTLKSKEAANLKRAKEISSDFFEGIVDTYKEIKEPILEAVGA